MIFIYLLFFILFFFILFCFFFVLLVSTSLSKDEKEDISTNEGSYTGNDYKSTTYRKGYYETEEHNTMGTYIDFSGTILDFENLTTGEYKFDFDVNDNGERLSDARDIYARRLEVNDYSDNAQINHIAEVLASFEEQQKATGDEIKAYLNELYENTYMYADSGVINVNTEYYMLDHEDNRKMERYDYGVSNNNTTGTGCYTIANLDFGLEERPKAQLKTNVEVANLKITMSNGNVLFDSSKTATNLQWTKHQGHGNDFINEYTRDRNYDNNSYPTAANFMKIPTVRQGNNGLITPVMDQETLHGAKIQITYNITVANIGEVDYYKTVDSDPCSWYNKHVYSEDLKPVTTTAKELVCYVGTQTVPDGVNNDKVEVSRNNLKFDANANKKGDTTVWEVIKQEEICKLDGESTNLVNYRLRKDMENYDVVIHTTKDSEFYNKELIPLVLDYEFADDIPTWVQNDPLHVVDNYINNYREDEHHSVVGEKLILSSTLSGDFSTNDMTYNNLVELVRVDNTVGRRMAFSIVGNQSPILDPTEIDADLGEEVSILPPFGEAQFNYYLGFGLAGIMIIGGLFVMIFTKKKY